MSQELVEARTRALFNKFWNRLPEDPQWLKRVLQDNPDVLQKLLGAFTSDNPAGEFVKVTSAVRQIATEEARGRAITEVNNPPFSLEWVEETLKYD